MTAPGRWWQRLAREPLVHFVVAAGVLFAVERVTRDARAADVPETIVVDREALLRTLQARAQRFDRGWAEARLDALPVEEQRALVQAHVREEALYREALELGLDREDYMVRRRLGQSVELLVRGMAGATAPLDEEALRARWAEERERWRLPPTRTVEHVFFAAEGDGAEEAEVRARAWLEAGEAEPAPGDGDRFHAGARFEGRSARTLARHFGPALARTLFELQPGSGWRGPYRSGFGAHLVRVVEEQPGRVPAFEEVRGQVEAAVRAELEEELGDEAVRRVVAGYAVRLERELAELAPLDDGGRDAETRAGRDGAEGGVGRRDGEEGDVSRRDGEEGDVRRRDEPGDSVTARGSDDADAPATRAAPGGLAEVLPFVGGTEARP